ncbi:MAG: NAD(P)-dependent oxidoreductase [Acetobacteraceae bacterium]|nr:NAD(P)-dependent oxidoreductase [Acetobacteraceae bacterium]
MTLAFVGLGLMGSPMAVRLARAGHPLRVWNRTAAKCAAAVAAGATQAASAADAARGADIVFLCLSDSRAVEAAVFGPEGVAEGIGAGAVVVDFSSVAPDATRAFAARLKAERGAEWVDAPVSGGVAGAEAGTLAVMAGGDQAACARVEPYVKAMAARFTRMGPVGAGQTTKLCNQVIVGSLMCVIAEAARLAANAGIDALKLPEALSGGWADSKPLQICLPRMVKAIHDPPLGAAWTMLKDLDAARALAQRTNTPLPVSAAAAEVFRTLCAREGDEADALRIFALSAPRQGEHGS